MSFPIYESGLTEIKKGMDPRQELKLLARGLVRGTGQSGLLCPFCHGGRTEEKSMSIHVRDDSMVLYICHRASCGKHGRIFPNGNVISSEATPQAKQWEPRWFKGETRGLSAEECRVLDARFGLGLIDIRRHRLAYSEEYRRLVVPVFNTSGTIRGYELRVFNRDLSDVKEPKTLHFKHLDQPWIGWFSNGREFSPANPVVLVEDVISAMKVAHQYVAVSLMGSHVSMDDLFEVTKLTDNIILALDRDATEKALGFKKKYRFLCPNLRVMILQQDLKYSTDDEIQKLMEAIV